MNLRRTLLAAVALSVAGLGISLYLTWVYMADAVIQCGSSGGCTTVQHSAFAWVGGVPVPMLGAIAYSLLIALLIVAVQMPQRRDLSMLALVGGTLVGVLFSAFLTYVEFFVIDAICRWCVASAVIMLLLFALVLVAWRQHQAEEE